MALQDRLTNVPQMFSEGIEETPADASCRQGAVRLLFRSASRASAKLAASFASRAGGAAARSAILRA